MRLESTILICRSADDIWKFLAEPSNVAKWDRGVAAVEVKTARVPGGVGFEFTTVGHADSGQDRGRMTYRITETDPVKGCKVELTSTTGNARFFKTAQWHFRVEDLPKGSWVVCSAEFKMRLRYLVLAPILYVMKGAIHRDLINLKKVLENA